MKPFPTSAKAKANLRRQAREREAALAVLRTLRSQARAEIDRLLAFLDASDIDPDLEPSLGFPEMDLRHYKSSDQSLNEIEDGRCGTTDDREDGDGDLEPSLCGVTAHGVNMPATDSAVDDGEKEADDEPSLGSIETLNQANWAAGAADNREDEHDGREPSEDDEPSIGFDEAEQNTGDDEPSLGWTLDGALGQCEDRELAVEPRSPQERTRVRSTPELIGHFRDHVRWADRYRFNAAIKSRSPHGDSLSGGELSFPGGQAAFDEFMRGPK